jgi:hemerythrin-like domain-containing protein
MDRRKLLRLAGASAAGFAASRRAPAAETRATGPEPSPSDDLMHGQGLLERVLLVYEESVRRLGAGEPVQPEIVRDAAQIVRGYLEDHHQKLEEKHVFPRFERSTAKEHAALVQVLREQHQAGRRLTDRILKLAETRLDDPVGRAQMQSSLRDAVRMLRPHESREDSVLFPAFRRLVSPAEYRELGAELRKSDARGMGLDMMVEKVSSLERQLGVHDLAKFTPKA